jgi:DtxR family transcriptional regulator, Mn-dependent transcriptional regulator
VLINQQERETLKAIWRLAQDDGEARTGDLAVALGCSPATATSRVKRLTADGLVDHAPYQGVTLTPDGRRFALAAIRRHRIVERFLADVLGYRWDEADALSVTFEHHLPQEVEERLFVALGRPATCPHGFSIPAGDADSLPTLPTLDTLEPGEVAEVAIPGTTNPDVVSFLNELGIRPGVEVRLKEKQRFEGPLTLSVDGSERTLGNRLAREIYVRPKKESNR